MQGTKQAQEPRGFLLGLVTNEPPGIQGGDNQATKSYITTLVKDLTGIDIEVVGQSVKLVKKTTGNSNKNIEGKLYTKVAFQVVDKAGAREPASTALKAWIESNMRENARGHVRLLLNVAGPTQ